MYFFKKKKNKILIYALLASLITSLSFGSVIYYSFSDANISFETSSNGITDAELTPINNATNDAIISNRDNKLKPSLEKIIKESEKQEPNKLIIPKKEEKEIKEAAKPEIKPEINKPQSSTIRQNTSRSKTKISINGVEVEAEIEGPVGFYVHDQDRTRRITNPTKPYQNHTVGKIISIEVTEELKKSVLDNALVAPDGHEDRGAGLFNNTLMQVFDSELNGASDVIKALETLEAIGKVNSDFFKNNIERYQKLLDSPKVVDFLKEDAKKKYPELKTKFKTKTQEYIWLIHNLDKSKFTTIASRSEKYLKEGLTISPRNAFINENGEIDSHSWGPPAQFNTVTSRMQRDNSEYRIFDYDAWQTRTPGDIDAGNFPGWKKENVTSQFTHKFGFNENDGITVTRLTREKQTNAKDKINTGLVLELDVSNPNAYKKAKDLINKFKTNDEKITSYRIKNMGEVDTSQSFKQILDELPNEIPQLELFFSDKATNTASLIALENKKIKELSLFTNGNSLREAWSYNPLSFRNTTYINNLDYNVSYDYSKYEKISTRITFNTLAFDENDYKNNGDYQRINDGLRMVYYARNNEPFFQGAFGPGLTPDKKLGDNSYPSKLDFSRVTGIKSLKGLIFHDEYDSSNKPRKITELTLYNNQDFFEIEADELDKANLEHLSTGENSPIKPKINFSNGNSTRGIRIKGTSELTESGRKNLEKYFDYSDSLKFAGKQIQVDANSTKLKEQLRSWGYSLSDSNTRSFT
ncbi:putative immunoglobulin-blocking virulence protein [Mycoplasma mycoides]|uniref:putative immunoglobulin-blocking virulence protein n=1 Tax=Mycoplasma mycoides TaxID=2102 RepID=UPI002240390F|nr:putative immunoglobulin-blocking virulence protein [Mycoplasma mycoides]QVK02543.1 putative immunoglobulin-blocking virulence protein [Mycoplasma mycoides subsp. capri]QVK03358.1 putative immunoglobulin-blocking virulence protein [Mycoplasma mycoides subsp. capri]